MSTPVTIEDIYKLFQRSQEEFDRRLAEAKVEADRRQAEYDRRLAEMNHLALEAKAEADRLAAEANRRATEYDHRLAEANRFALEAKAKDDRRLAETNRLALEAKAKDDRRLAETNRLALEAKAEDDRRLAEANRLAIEAKAETEKGMAQLLKTVERTSKAVDALTTRWGRFVEELVEPAVLQLFQNRGIDVKEVHPRTRTKRQGFAMEIDILAVDDTELVLVECKSRLSKDDVDEFLEKLARFKQSFPHYSNYQAYGAVAGIEINEGIDRYAAKKGLFVIKPSGETVAIANEPDFQAATW